MTKVVLVILGAVATFIGLWAVTTWVTMVLEGALVHEVGWPGTSWGFGTSLVVSIALWWVAGFWRTAQGALGGLKEQAVKVKR